MCSDQIFMWRQHDEMLPTLPHPTTRNPTLHFIKFQQAVLVGCTNVKLVYKIAPKKSLVLFKFLSCHIMLEDLNFFPFSKLSVH